jgi:hypothetical protein
MLFVRFNLAVLVNEVRAGDGGPTHIAGAERELIALRNSSTRWGRIWGLG